MEWIQRQLDEIPDLLEKQGIGKKTVNYKLRDWIFSRQGIGRAYSHCSL